MLANFKEDRNLFQEKVKGLNSEELMAFVERHFDEISKKEQEERNDLKEFSESLENTSAKDKAYKFIEYYYKKYRKSFGDEEFLVLLISRGVNFREVQSNILDVWRSSSINAISNGSQNESTKEVDISILEQDVETSSQFVIPNFWYGKRNERNSIDATMLRVAKWVHLSGFKGYWVRLVNEVEVDISDDIFDKIQFMKWMFSMCRSDYAIELMYEKFKVLLDIINVKNKYSETKTWEFVSYDLNYSNREIRRSPYIAGALMFIILRLGKKELFLDLLNEIKEYLMKVQSMDGGWKMFSHNIDISIETTALCIHSLALYDIDESHSAIKKGVNCLYKKQDTWGLWFEKDEYFVSSEYLTVLVLDAIEISEKHFELLTFDFTKIPHENNTNKNQTIINNMNNMNNHFNINNSQVGAVGPDAKAISNEFKQVNTSEPKDFDYVQLNSELEKLKIALIEKAKKSEEFSAISNLVLAEEASKEKNYNAVLENLKKGGKWVFETAKEIGVSIVSDIISKKITG